MHSQPESILQSWTHQIQTQGQGIVLPDGCRDLIVQVLPNGRRQWMVSTLDTQAYAVQSEPGTLYIGYRFQPSSVFDAQKLFHAVESKCHTNGYDEHGIFGVIEDCVSLDWRLDEVLCAIAQTSTVVAAANMAGVSQRTLERLVKSRTGQPPTFWKALVRVRRTIRSMLHASRDGLARTAYLADLAAANGYADQAHMSREFGRWLGVAPSVFKKQPRWQEALLPGYD